MTRDLEGRVAVVTGGTRGIGRAISLALARRGANVVPVFFRNRSAAEEAAGLIEDLGVKALPVKAHLGEPDAVKSVFEQVAEAFGRADVLVSNAATGVIKPLEQLDLRAWSWAMDANARALYLAALAARPLMEAGSSIVALSSGGATRVLPGYSVIGTSKAAIEALVRYIAVEFAGAGIRANAVSPGVVDTDALKHFPIREDMLSKARTSTPAGRMVEPEDVAGVVDFLTSERSAMITGQTIVVDGGASLLA